MRLRERRGRIKEDTRGNSQIWKQKRTNRLSRIDMDMDPGQVRYVMLLLDVGYCI